VGALRPGSLPGKLVYVGDANVWVWEQGSAQRLTGDRISRHPSWSPDGRYIAHVKLDVNSSEVWVMDADSSNSRQLTHNENPTLAHNHWAFRPTWWPDGSRLLYLTEIGTSDLMLWQVGLDGKNQRPLLTLPNGEGGLDMPSLSPDGKQLALAAYRGARGAGQRSQVWTYGLPSGPWRQLTEADEGAYDPAWSPDGSRLAYVVRGKGKHDVWVMDADGSNQRPVTESGACRAPCWSPDGQYLAYVAAESNAFDLWVAPAPAEAPEGAAAPDAAGPTSAKQLTRGALVDAVSGLSWTR
jgi:TolB protein